MDSVRLISLIAQVMGSIKIPHQTYSAIGCPVRSVLFGLVLAYECIDSKWLYRCRPYWTSGAAFGHTHEQVEARTELNLLQSPDNSTNPMPGRLVWSDEVFRRTKVL